MKLINKWTNPLSRSFTDIKEDLIKSLQTITDRDGKPLITDISEGNIFIIIISLFAAIAEVLHYYIDNMARETFLTTARRYSSVVKHALLVDYHPRLANAATVDVVVSRVSKGVNSGAKIKIPKGTVFKDSLGNPWETTKDIQWDSNSFSIKISLIQHELYTSSVLNDTLYTGNSTIPLDTNLGDNLIENNGVQLQLGSENWIQVETFAYSKPTDNHFMVTVDNSDKPIITFGDGKFGRKPSTNVKIKVYFFITKGSKGNISSNSIVTVPNLISSVMPAATCNNPYSAGDGMDYEDIEMIRSHASIQTRTMGMLVTKDDIIDCVKLIPGVREAVLEFIQDKKVIVYISPSEGNTVASTSLIKKVSERLASMSMLANNILVYPAGVSKIHLELEIFGKPSYKDNKIYGDTLNTIWDHYSGDNSHIGGSIRVSDVYAMIDNLPSVDYLHLKKFYISPWPKTINGDVQLEMQLNDIEEANGTIEYILTIGNNNTFNLRSASGNFSTDQNISNNILIEDTKNGFKFSMSITGVYQSGYRYSFTIHQPNLDYTEIGFNQIIFDDPSLLKTIIHETV